MVKPNDNSEAPAAVLDRQQHPICCTTTSTIFKAELKWTIENFGRMCNSKTPGEKLGSAVFFAPNAPKVTWKLKLFPNGMNEEHKGHISMCVYSYQKSSPTGIMFNVDVSLCDANSRETLWSDKFSAQHSVVDVGKNYNRIMQAPFLSMRNLQVLCSVEYEKDEIMTWHSSLSISPSSSDLNSNLAQLWTSMHFWDVTFVIAGSKEYHAHKAILVARSPVFASMFQHDMKEAALNRVDIVDIEPDIFQAVLRFIYTDQVDLTVDNCKNLLAASNHYFLDLLKWKCETFMAADLAIENCTETLLLADLYDATELKKSAINFIRNSSALVMKTDGWKNLLKNCRPEFLHDVIKGLVQDTA